MPAISKVPPALRHSQYGGLNMAAEYRKENFLRAGPSFLLGLGSQLGMGGRIETTRGAKKESGIARFVADRMVLEMSEPPERNGLQIKCIACDAETHAPIADIALESVEGLAPEGAIEDFVWRMKRLLADTKPGASPAPPDKNQTDLFT